MTVPDAIHDARAAALAALGLSGPEADLDEIAARLAHQAQAPYAMVNIFGREQQFFGLHAPTTDDLRVVGRTMPLEHGFCPDVVDRKKALVLPDVFASPRFAGNAVVDLIGIRTYAGAPLIHDDVVLGTVCYVGTEERDVSTGQESLALIKAHAEGVMTFLHHRAGLRLP